MQSQIIREKESTMIPQRILPIVPLRALSLLPLCGQQIGSFVIPSKKLPTFLGLPSILRLPPPLRLKCIFGGREERTSSSSSSQPLLGEWMLCYGSSGNSRLLVNIGHLRSGRNERRESERNERPRPRPRTRPLSITTQSSPSSGPIARWPR